MSSITILPNPTKIGDDDDDDDEEEEEGCASPPLGPDDDDDPFFNQLTRSGGRAGSYVGREEALVGTTLFFSSSYSYSSSFCHTYIHT